MASLFPVILPPILFMICFGVIVEGSMKSLNIGAIIDAGTRTGKEQKTAMVMAVDYFNNLSRYHNYKLVIHFREISNDPIQAVLSAEELINEDQVEVIVGLQTWEQATMVAEVGRRAQIPVLSLTSTASATASKITQLRWPFLVPVMPNNSSEQMDCIAAIVQFYSWRKVIVIYAENVYGGTGDSGMLAQLSGALQSIGAEIESCLGFPPPSSLINSETFVREEVAKLLRRQSRVFIILQESLSLATNLFTEAKQMGLMGRDSAWIISNAISDLLDSVDTSFFSSAQGALGIKKYFPEESGSYQEFRGQFRKIFRSVYPDEPNNLEPGIHALRAYDAISAVYEAKKDLGTSDSNISVALLSKILASNDGIHFHRAESSSGTSIFRVINIVGKSYRELGFWSSGIGFFEEMEMFKNDYTEQNKKNLKVVVNWPGELNRTPKGWAMPTDAKPMKIIVPGRTSFEKFVKVEWAEEPGEIKYDGFCIKLFEEIIKILQEHYSLPYEFHPYSGTYDDLVKQVITKEYDAAVGDITILANRSRYVDFTQPFAESGLSMLVPVKNDHVQQAWMFLKPFTPSLWYATYGVLFYTMFVIWLIERNSDNDQFQGHLKDELGISLWFTFSSLFFAHKEPLKSNLTRAVVVVWLFLVFVLSSSYTASLTSMLTVPRLEPEINDLEWIRKTNAAVGTDADSFVKAYVRDVLDLRNIKNISNDDDLSGELDNGSIAAAFLELPYQKVFMEDHCNKYTAVGETYRFGGLGFVFQKGSPIARDFSKAILTLSENGKLKSLEDYWFGSSAMKCSSSEQSLESERLRIGSFWVLFIISAGTSTICLLIFLIRLYYRKNRASRNKNRGIPVVTQPVIQPRERRLSSPSQSQPQPVTATRSLSMAISRRNKASQLGLASPTSDHSAQLSNSSPTDEVGLIIVKD